MTVSKKKRCSSGHSAARLRLVWIGSGLMKCCGVCTIPTSGALCRAIARSMNFGKGTKSASRIATKSGRTFNVAKVRIAALSIAGFGVAIVFAVR